MALRISRDRTVLYPVVVQRVADGGKKQEQRFKCCFRLLSRKEQREIIREHMGQEGGTTESLRRAFDADRAERYDRLVIERTEGWEDVIDEAGQPVEFSKALLTQLMDEDTAFAVAVDQALWAASREEPVKN